jgi:predicted metal-dependent hydrolase
MNFAVFVIPTLILAEFSGLPLGGQDSVVINRQGASSQVATVAVTQPQTKVTDEVERDVKARLSSEMQSNEVFRGAWIEVVVPENREGLHIVPVLDAGQLKEQQKALEALLKEVITKVKYDLKPTRTRPISKFLAEVQAGIDVNFALGGCLVTGAYYRPLEAGSTEQELMLLGRIANPEQKDLITLLCKEAKELQQFRGLLQETLPIPDKMKVVTPSRRVASYMFNCGVDKFKKRDYVGAHQAFTRSILEAPDELNYRYWQVVVEIAQGNEDSAYSHLKPLVDRRRKGDGGYTQVLYSVGRVLRGPILQCYLKLEKRAFLE